jgi:hypothetical protein
MWEVKGQFSSIWRGPSSRVVYLTTATAFLAVSNFIALPLQLHDSRLRYLTWIKFRVVAHALPSMSETRGVRPYRFQDVASEE